MNGLGRCLSLCALCVALFSGCAHTPPTGARLTKPDAIRIAKEAARNHGIVLSHYKQPEARYLADGRTWFDFCGGSGC